MKTCVFAGTFDPITVGHEKLIEKCLTLYDNVIIVVGENKAKTTLFSSSQRAEIVRKVYENNDRITVLEYAKIEKNFTKYLLSLDVTDYVRGIRDEKDRAYEENQIEVNKKLYPFINTVFITADEEFKNLSSTIVRKKLINGEETSNFMSPNAYKKAKELLLQKQ